jgi:hypothetical protein
MTQPQAQTQAPAKQETVVFPVPPPTMPICTRVWSKSPWADVADPKQKVFSEDVILWAIDTQHPLVPTHRIVRMYAIPGGAVEVYSTQSGGGEVGLRHTIPWHEVKFIEEAMDPPTFIQEIIAAESDEEDEDDEDDEVPEAPPIAGELKPLPPAGGLPVNGQGGTS